MTCKPTIVAYRDLMQSYKMLSGMEINGMESDQLKEVAGAHQVVMVPFILYSDDTKGNLSKKWNKFDLWAMMFAGLPHHKNQHLENIHFLCTSNNVIPLELQSPCLQSFLC